MAKSVQFNVKADVSPNKAVFIVGSDHQVGEWNPQNALNLQLSESDVDQSSWSISVEFDGLCDLFYYRYFIGFVSSLSKKIIICSWEEGSESRCFDLKEDKLVQDDVYGVYEGCHKIKRGWLSEQTEIRLRLHSSPLKIWKSDKSIDSYHVKLVCGEFTEDLNTRDLNTRSPRLYDEVRVFSYKSNEYKIQPPMGVILSANNYLDFSVQTIEIDILYKFEISDSQAKTLGNAFVLLSNITSSTGKLMTTVCDINGIPIGQLHVEYLLIKPLINNNFDLNMDYKKSWIKKKPLNIGHRGMGSTKPDNLTYVENTVASLNKAFECGADFVEFDIHVTRDKVPIVYHDSMLNVLTKSDDKSELLKFPIGYFTSSQLKNLPLKHNFLPDELNSNIPKQEVESKLFPHLREIFEDTNPLLGFNIEIKYSQLMLNGMMEDSADCIYDRNEFADTVLVDILHHAGDRQIIFSSFDPDMCTLLRMKQNKYEVMFLAHTQVDKWGQYFDTRTHNFDMINKFAESEQLSGISICCLDIIEEPEVIAKAKMANLAVFCWGTCDDAAIDSTYFKNLGLDGVIIDDL